ncbi:MAG: class I SAM-dependent methyltransferase [Candidatus Bathyarchaeota archaeon]|nr:class I SAM-dependent methyltransferase [Candidatus Bathyarchaeota archaeon]
MHPEEKDAAFMSQFRCPKGEQGKKVAALMNTEHEALTTWGLQFVEIPKDATILDVGCGGGKTVNRLARMAPEGKIAGTDYSEDMVTYSKTVNAQLIKQGHVEIIEGSVENLQFPEGTFDLVTAVETYYFWSSLLDAFQQIHRVLKPQGKLLLINEMIKDLAYEKKNAETIKKAHVHLVALEEIKGLLEAAGFVKVQVFKKEETAWNVVLAQKP